MESGSELTNLIEQLKKHRNSMTRLYYILLAANVIYATLLSTPIISVLVGYFGSMMQGATVAFLTLFFRCITNLRLLIAIPAIYTIIIEMKEKHEKLIATGMLLLGWFYTFLMREWNDTYIFEAMLLIVSSYGKDFRKIAKLCIFSISGVCILSAVLNLAGILPSFDFERNGRVRHAFGMFGPTAIAGHMCAVLMALIFIRNGHLKWYDYSLIALLSALNLFLVDGRAAFATVFLATMGCVIYNFIKLGKLNLPAPLIKIIRFLLSHSYLIITFFYFLCVVTYKGNSGLFSFTIPYFSSIRGRFSVPHRIMNELPFSFFGNYFKYYYEAETTFYQGDEYNFIDSSFARMYLIYGLIGIILCVFIFSVIQHRLKKKDQLLRMYILTVSAFMFVVQKGILDPAVNIFPLLFFAVIDDGNTVSALSAEKESQDDT